LSLTRRSSDLVQVIQFHQIRQLRDALISEGVIGKIQSRKGSKLSYYSQISIFHLALGEIQPSDLIFDGQKHLDVHCGQSLPCKGQSDLQKMATRNDLFDHKSRGCSRIDQ